MGKILAVDYGTVRVGFALSDDEQRWAFGRGTVAVRTPAEAVTAVKQVIAGEDIDLIVVGLPLSLRGGDTAMVTKVQDFARALEEALDIPVEFEDERLSSSEATRDARAAGRPVREAVDERAAVIILESYLTRQRNSHARPA